MAMIETEERVQEITAPDLTRIKAPADIWPDPLECPDWPFSSGGHLRALPPGRAEAEAKLAALTARLNPDDATLRQPTAQEAQEALETYFRPTVQGESGGPQKRFAALGFHGWRPGVPNDRPSFDIVEAVHIRGFLRKLDAIEAEARERAEADDLALTRRPLEAYQREAPVLAKELDALAEAEARHLQRIADEKAWARAQEIRRTLATRHDHAVLAAYDLGIDAPKSVL